MLNDVRNKGNWTGIGNLPIIHKMEAILTKLVIECMEMTKVHLNEQCIKICKIDQT